MYLAPLVIHSHNVDEISTESFDDMKEKLEGQLSYYKRHQEAMEEQMKKDKEYLFQTTIKKWRKRINADIKIRGRRVKKERNTNNKWTI